MRRKLTLTAILGIMLAVGVAAIAIANGTLYVSTCLRSTSELEGECGGRLVADFGGGVVPKSLPKREMAPVAIELWGRVSTDDGTHHAALREATIDFDRNLAISAKGLPVCDSGHRDPVERDSIPKACDSSIVGGGKADFELAFPERPPILNPSKLTVYNGGAKGGVTTLYGVVRIKIPAPRTIAIPVEFERIHDGHHGLRAVAKTPVIAGGSGSLLDFRLKIKRLFSYRGSQRSYATARCPDGNLDAEVSALFKNEVGTPGVASTTAIKGALAFPCMPTD